MSSKATVTAPSNIAFLKYWGAADLERAVPLAPSISMTLRRCSSRTTVKITPGGTAPDEIALLEEDGGTLAASERFRDRVTRHLSLLAKRAGVEGSWRVATSNNFPAAAGLASSASGFAALTLAATQALGLDLPVEELSSLARLSGSGSAARSVLGGYVEWPARPGEERCHAVQIAPASHWDLRDVIAVVDEEPKNVSSLEGHRRAPSSPYFESRLRALPGKLAGVRDAIGRRDLAALGLALEEEAIDLHLIAMSSRPPIFYWRPGTVRVLDAVRAMREDGAEAWATLDAGPNVHVICSPRWEEWVHQELARLPEVRQTLLDGVGTGPRVETEHLF